MGLGEIFSLACAVSWAVAVILFRKTSHQLDAFSTNLVKNTLAFILLFLTILLVDGFQWPDLTQEQIILSLVSGMIGIAVADVLYLKTLALIGASRTAIIGSLYSPFVVTGSFIFLAESLNLQQMIGFASVMFGVGLATWQTSNRQTNDKQYILGITIGTLSIFLMASAVLMLKETLETASFFWVVEIRLAGALFISCIPLMHRGLRQKTFHALREFKQWKTLLIASFLGTYLAMILWLAGYRYTSASIASILNETASIFIVVMAWIFLKEPLGPKKAIGVFFTTVGVFLIILFQS